jgi:hypothetical protein
VHGIFKNREKVQNERKVFSFYMFSIIILVFMSAVWYISSNNFT